MTSKKVLKEAYKQMKPEMGIFKIESKTSGNCYLHATQDLKAKMNRFHFQLQAGTHPHRQLQAEWKLQGAAGFVVEILEHLQYDNDESKADYTEELELLHIIWEERLDRPLRI